MKLDAITSKGDVLRWSLVDGIPRCIEDAIPSADAGATAALQRTAAIQAMLDLVDPYEAAQAIVAAGEPDNGQPRAIADPEWIDPEDGSTAPMVANPGWALLPRMIENHIGDVTEMVPEPRWQAFDAAAATAAGASPMTVAHARWRAGDATQADDVSTALAALAALPLEHDPRPVSPEAPLWAVQAVLKQLGVYDQIETFVQAHKDANPIVYFAWTMGNVVSRDSLLVKAFAPEFDLTPPKIDGIFRAADALSRAA